MVNHIGLDVHKRLVVACVMDESGTILARDKIEDFDADDLRRWLERIARPGDRVALEVTTNCHAIARVLRDIGCEVTLSNPMATKAIAQSKVKTDKVDAKVLAHLLRCGYLPSVWQPDDATSSRRELVARRAALVRQRILLKNRIHATLAVRLIVPPPRLFNPEGRQWLATLAVDERARRLVDSDLRLLERVEEEIAVWDQELAREAWQSEEAKLLMTIPGVDRAVAMTLLACLGDVSRFRDADAATAYVGLVPSTRQSASRCHHGGITKRGNRHARWMLIQAAQHLDKHPGPLGAFFRKVESRKCRNVAVVAAARKMCAIAWHMLRKKEPYRYAVPATTQVKLARLRIDVTGKRHTGGVAKKTKATRVLAEPSRKVPSLAEICEREGLPAPKPLSPGEQRTVEAADCQAFVAAIQSGTRRARSQPEPKTTRIKRSKAEFAETSKGGQT